jgi:hypothetical protein
MVERHSLEEKVIAIIDRDMGIDYPKVLRINRITPNQFYRTAEQLSDYIKNRNQNPELERILSQHSILIDILSDEKRKTELFRMGFDLIEEQCNQIKAKKLVKPYFGTFIHPENRDFLSYYALISNNSGLDLAVKIRDRKRVIELLKNLPKNTRDYFRRIGLKGVMEIALKEDKSSTYVVLEGFDRVYQKFTRDKSIFDLEQEHHIHEWGDNILAPRYYGRNPKKVEDAIYHTLNESNPGLKIAIEQKDRKKVVNEIISLPTSLKRYFYRIGLTSLMTKAFEKGEFDSPLAVLKAYDCAYQRYTQDKSLFDLSKEDHVHEWGNVKSPVGYWENYENLEKAVYHIIQEDNPGLKRAIEQRNRKEVVGSIRGFPRNLKDYFYEIGITNIMNSSGRGKGIITVLKIFDLAYQKETGDKSLFSYSDDGFLDFDARNSLKRK